MQGYIGPKTAEIESETKVKDGVPNFLERYQFVPKGLLNVNSWSIHTYKFVISWPRKIKGRQQGLKGLTLRVSFGLLVLVSEQTTEGCEPQQQVFFFSQHMYLNTWHKNEGCVGTGNYLVWPKEKKSSDNIGCHTSRNVWHRHPLAGSFRLQKTYWIAYNLFNFPSDSITLLVFYCPVAALTIFLAIFLGYHPDFAW